MNLADLQGQVNTDCRDEDGVTVGLIDGVIAQIRILRKRDLSCQEVQEAFLDMAADEDIQWLCEKLNMRKDSSDEDNTNY